MKKEKEPLDKDQIFVIVVSTVLIILCIYIFSNIFTEVLHY